MPDINARLEATDQAQQAQWEARTQRSISRLVSQTGPDKSFFGLARAFLSIAQKEVADMQALDPDFQNEGFAGFCRDLHKRCLKVVWFQLDASKRQTSALRELHSSNWLQLEWQALAACWALQSPLPAHSSPPMPP
ncbi:hypothetical protein [Epibacterium sp. Ofav1-8]|uniref:hypothetical protein n=1 Tax=Epibacterium sp. Ofav1-8 TaxID=2917735 RepID=UPI001EF57D0C|nr:hypothetical protein [Epibacterium sp. Ofav1-8]MCG7623206.1 hypothetical protein [Epibacterium sp. Ofav1-8]